MKNSGDKLIAGAQEALKVVQCNHALVNREVSPWRCCTCKAVIHSPQYLSNTP